MKDIPCENPSWVAFDVSGSYQPCGVCEGCREYFGEDEE